MVDVRVVAVVLALAMLAGCADAGTDPVQDAAAEGFLRGVVVTAAIVPIPGAQLTLAPGDILATSDGDGAFEIGPLAPGPYRLVARAPGYNAASMDVEVVAGGGRTVNVVLAARSTDVPYHEVDNFKGYVECSYAQRFAGVVGGNFNCLGITDLVLGIPVGNDRDHFLFTVNAGGFRGMYIEMLWEPQSTGPRWSAMVRDPVDAGGGLGLEGQYWSGVSENPLTAWVLQGIENDGAYQGDVFHPDRNVTGQYEYLIAGMTDTSQPVDVAIMLEQDLEIFLSRFYHALPDDSYCVACI